MRWPFKNWKIKYHQMFIKFKQSRFTLEVEECVARCVNLFNSFWNKGEWPQQRKEAVVTVIFVIKLCICYWRLSVLSATYIMESSILRRMLTPHVDKLFGIINIEFAVTVWLWSHNLHSSNTREEIGIQLCITYVLIDLKKTIIQLGDIWCIISFQYTHETS
jgi:hypothetical protein